MAINAIPFQKEVSLEDFMKQYGTEKQCEEAFAQVRWHDGFRCPQTAAQNISATVVRSGTAAHAACR
jgi:hypothetical protein